MTIKVNTINKKIDLQLFGRENEERRTREEIETRLSEIRSILEEGEGNLEELENEISELNEERGILEEIEKRNKLAEEINLGDVNPKVIDRRESDVSEKEQRGKDLKENRAVMVSSSNVVLPKHSSAEIKPTFNEISSLIDRVSHMDLPGGESFKQPYVIHKSGEGGQTKEGETYTNTEPKTDYATIGKAKTTAYSEVSEEVEKLPSAPYAQLVEDGVSDAIRKKITRQILIGTGEVNELVGIFSDKAKAIDPKKDKNISEINEKTLDDIIYSYGGDEDVEDVAVLILNKADIKEFAMLRTKDGKKVYEVKHNGNTGTIDTVPYIINSACSSISKGKVGDYCMAYGSLSNYTLALFSDIEIMKSYDYKFGEGLIAHKGSTFSGGNVTSYNGFLRVKKGDEVVGK